MVVIQALPSLISESPTLSITRNVLTGSTIVNGWRRHQTQLCAICCQLPRQNDKRLQPSTHIQTEATSKRIYKTEQPENFRYKRQELQTHLFSLILYLFPLFISSLAGWSIKNKEMGGECGMYDGGYGGETSGNETTWNY